MKKWLKITLIILLVLFLILTIIGAYGYTKYQKVKPLLKLVNQQEQINADLNALARGDCSKLPAVEAKAAELAKGLSNSCSDKVLVYFIKKYSPQNPCIIDLDKLKTGLQQIKTVCDMKK